ncbi:ComF family protein [Candidatus Nomurabacteria bacterium]|nr:ComF family protein [Candidatus Nomurabacteria bacterium]
MNILETILNIIFPVNCEICGKNDTDFCLDCLILAPEAERENAKWIFSMFDYRHPPIKKSIWLLKYKNKKRLAKIFAEVLYGRILEELADLFVFENFNNPILIPIPLAPKRKRERGYNQTELICENLIKIDAKNSTKQNANFTFEKNILIKPKDTEHQARIKNRNKRLKNLKNSFMIKNPEKIKGRNIILIDDVTTTGATLDEARKTLKKYGAKKIFAFTIAH